MTLWYWQRPKNNILKSNLLMNAYLHRFMPFSLVPRDALFAYYSAYSPWQHLSRRNGSQVLQGWMPLKEVIGRFAYIYLKKQGHPWTNCFLSDQAPHFRNVGSAEWCCDRDANQTSAESGLFRWCSHVKKHQFQDVGLIVFLMWITGDKRTQGCWTTCKKE